MVKIKSTKQPGEIPTKQREWPRIRRKKKQGKKEQKLQTRISDYIRNRYPGYRFFCDVAAGLKLTPGMAMLVKRWRSNRGFCDLFLFVRRGRYAMLQLEIKTGETNIYKKDGSLRKDVHLEEQDHEHTYMNQQGYLAMFSQGYDHAIAVVDWYMAGADGHPPTFQQMGCEIDQRQTDFFRV